MTKTKFMVFHQAKKKFKLPDIKMNDIYTEHVDTFNFLGITLDKQLDWNAHIEVPEVVGSSPTRSEHKILLSKNEALEQHCILIILINMSFIYFCHLFHFLS